MTNNGESEFELDRVVRETFVENVQYHQAIDSTNNAALKLCQQGEFRGPVLVVASRQTAGRGRGANRWWSSPGALTFSLVIQPKELGVAEELWPQASLTTGLAVCLAVDDFLLDNSLQLKWPNDVHLDGRKVCGVLVEVAPRSSETLIVGIGLNVNNSFDQAPIELQAIATSLVDVNARSENLTDVLVRLLVELEAQWIRLAAGDPSLTADWQARCALKGQQVEVMTGQQTIHGNCLGIGDDGALLIQTETDLERIFGGVVSKIS